MRIHKRAPFGAGFCPCFPEWLVLLHSWWGAGAGGCTATGMLTGGQRADSPQACSSWKYCAWAVGSTSGEAAEHVWMSFHVVWLHLFVLLASFFSSGAPGNLVPVSCLSNAYTMNLGFPLLFFAASLSFLNSNDVESGRKRFNNRIHLLTLQRPSPKSLDTLNAT